MVKLNHLACFSLRDTVKTTLHNIKVTQGVTVPKFYTYYRKFKQGFRLHKSRSYYLTSLHEAACEGDINKLKRLIARKQCSINVTDRFGMTPLHYAAMKDHYSAAVLLVGNGARLRTDVDGHSPIFYAKEHSKLRAYLLRVAKQHAVKRMHVAAFRGDVAKIKAFLPQAMEAQDAKQRTALLHAARGEQRKTLDYLLDSGADPYVTDEFSQNIIDYTKKDFRHTELSRYIKSKIGIAKEKLRDFQEYYRRFFTEQLAIATRKRKKLIVLLGEIHGDYRIYQLEKKVLTTLSELGVNHLFVEAQRDNERLLSRYQRMTQKFPTSMIIDGVDNHPQRDTATLNQRNRYIRDGIHQTKQHGVMITGIHHLYGLVKKNKTQLDRKKFHIVPMNFSAFFEKQRSYQREEKFAFNRKKVVQVSKI